ncbi:MAG: deoxyribose-phosphate aldolase [Mycoplasmataceae bacterium]|jgi:deoxyribose-phosphate aldolase|nr:deoxyribose-phosphate aldolase [Mycoplasmataceae bacterium]
MTYNHYIDHTALKATTTKQEIETLCAEAKEHKFASVCVNPCFVPLCKKLLEGTKVNVCTVIGFPLGANGTSTKVFEITKAISEGATEIDMVMNISLFKSHQYDEVINEIKMCKTACSNAILKVIVETCYLDDEEKKQAVACVKRAGADFIKTSTGFGPSGATVKDIQLFKKYAGKGLKIKASGGINTHAQMVELIKAGANRIGTSKGTLIYKK